ncbi:PAM68 family protein [Prochlorococcus sp. MIT 1223]|uniref:PAM68 family protein n=1 Tax=Prochlorococcus sp. MIT 1223 TaxID=3096217 RepID=UPI002A74A38E|nr:PAM68 family protein [Prochlorococcus sp. MIT 1223]
MNKKDTKSTDFENQITQTGFKEKALTKKKQKNSSGKRETGIPKEVANRMARRIAITTGIPTLSGMGVFIGSYYLITKGIADIAPVVTLMTSGGCFLFGLLGLSYGILSASWDKSAGTFLGLENINPNIRRMKEAFKAKESTN